MKKIIAIAVVALLMFSMASSAFGLVVPDAATGKVPPIYVNNLVVGDTYLNPFTVKNWSGTNTTTAYAANSNIWFIAEIVVAGWSDTDGADYWNDAADSAKLVVTGKDNCLNFTAASQATMAMINGLNVTTQPIINNQNAVYATANKVEYYFNSTTHTGVADRVLTFDQVAGVGGRNLANLTLDGIFNADLAAYGNNFKTMAKSFYLHFMAMTNEATEGEAIATMTLAGRSDFQWTNAAAIAQGETNTDVETAYLASIGAATPIARRQDVASPSNTTMYVGDRSVIWPLFNTVNGEEYRIFKMNNFQGPWNKGGVMYVIMNKDMDKNIISFVVADDAFQGLAKYRNHTGQAPFSVIGATAPGTNPANYACVASNDLSGSAVALYYADTMGLASGEAISKAKLQEIFDFFGFAYVNPSAPQDKHFLARTGFTSVANAKYNVANAVVPVADIDIVIPKTGDAATSTGIILAASAILAAAAVGFVLSKRVHN